MMKCCKFILIFTLASLLFGTNSFSQYANKKVRTKHEAYTDSLKQIEYNYTFPIWGQKIYQKGFDIPYPAGAMLNYIWMKQGLIIENLQLGFTGTGNDIPLTEVDFIQFGQNTNTSYSLNVRPDLWVLPFLNVYGLFGYGSSHTVVNITAPIELQSVVDQNLKTGGFGFLLAGGVGPIFITSDVNWTWTKPELLEEPVLANVVGIRVGHSFVFKHKPQSNIAVWAGAQYFKMGAQTVGAIALKDALPPEFWETKDQFVDDYYGWYDEQSDAVQKIADEVLTPIVENIDSKNGEGVVEYAMNKKTKEPWNGLVGLQYQHNKRWQFRTEAGLIGDRKSGLFSVNYRFRL